MFTDLCNKYNFLCEVSMKKLIIATIFSIFFVSTANAQFAAQKDAEGLIILKVVADYKINDESHTRNVEKLRENKRFNEKLEKILAELDNRKSKNSKNRQILQILEQAGKDIDNILNVR